MADSYRLQGEFGELEAPIILFEHVSKAYQKGIHALEDVTIRINKGEFVFIVGSSGSGKSTLIKLMLKEISPTKGRIYIAKKELSRLRRSQIGRFRRSIGVVFQDFRLLKNRNVYDNVAFAQRVVGAPVREMRQKVPRMLSLVGITETKYKSFPEEMSGGEQQRVALARALVNSPVILLADEPTGNLDPKNSWEIMNLLEEANRRGMTVVVVTHNREIVDMMQKRVITLKNGRLISDEQKGGYSYAKR